MEYQEKLYVIYHEAKAVHFYCRTCGTQLALARVEDKCTNNLFCFCGRQYWVDWQENVLHMGLDDDQIIQARLTRALRINGVGKRIP